MESRTQNLYTKTMESSITLCAMADNGTLAVVTEDPRQRGPASGLLVLNGAAAELEPHHRRPAPRCGWPFRRMGGGWQWRR